VLVPLGMRFLEYVKALPMRWLLARRLTFGWAVAKGAMETPPLAADC
jgi:hypothetical protein